MKSDPPIKSVMTAFPYSIDRCSPLLEARRMMLEHRVHHLPVTDNHDLTGIVSDRDIKLLLGPEMDYPDPRKLTVEDAFVANAYAVDISTPLSNVLLEMAARHIGAALVTGHGRLAGIFTATDACRQFGQWLREKYPPPGPGTEAA